MKNFLMMYFGALKKTIKMPLVYALLALAFAEKGSLFAKSISSLSAIEKVLVFLLLLTIIIPLAGVLYGNRKLRHHT